MCFTMHRLLMRVIHEMLEDCYVRKTVNTIRLELTLGLDTKTEMFIHANASKVTTILHPPCPLFLSTIVEVASSHLEVGNSPKQSRARVHCLIWIRLENVVSGINKIIPNLSPDMPLAPPLPVDASPLWHHW